MNTLITDDIKNAWQDMRLSMTLETFGAVVQDVQKHKDEEPVSIASFIDGGDEGWECGDEEHQSWLNTSSIDEISSWVVAGIS